MDVKERCGKAMRILSQTNDGDSLDPLELKLLEHAVNGFLSAEGYAVFDELYRSVVAGTYQKPYFHGIEHLTIDHEGSVYWKGQHVEHYRLSWAYSAEAKAEALELARRSRILEERGEQVSYTRVIGRWQESDSADCERANNSEY